MASIEAIRAAEAHEPAGRPGPSLQTAGGVAAILESVGIVVSGVLILGVAPALGMKDTYWGEPSKSVPVIAGHLMFFTSAALFLMLAALILFPVVLALHQRLREQAPGVVAVATALGLVGTTMLFLNALLQYAEFHIVGEYSRAFAVQAMPDAQIVYDATGGAADVAFGLWTLLVSWVVIRHGGLPRCIGYKISSGG